MNFLHLFHKLFIYDKRTQQICNHILSIISKFKINEILDIGSGDGKIDRLIMNKSKVKINGIDVLIRDHTHIPVEKYNGQHINKKDNSVMSTMMIDVLHHTERPDLVLKEAARVSKKYVIIKDHILHNYLSLIKLKAMDYVGNKHHGVNLPYNYMKAVTWNKIIKQNKLKIVYLKQNLNLYKGILHILFDSNLHFIAVLKKT